MNTYITIIGTFLAICEIIRVIQNHINLTSDITDRDLQIRREVYEMLHAELMDRRRNCKAEGGGEDGK